MSTLVLGLALTFVTQSSDGSRLDLSESSRRERVEAVLRPAIMLADTPPRLFHLVDRMKFYKVPGVSVAVIHNGEVAWSRGYGLLEAGSETAVTTETLFQAASISKPVATAVVLRLVEQGHLDLDEDVNRRLRTWTLPENDFTRKNGVTLRLLLSHRGGLTDFAGFRSAQPDAPLPTLREVLESGRWTPAPVRVGMEPGSRFAYSGGGFCLIEQLVEDVTHLPFPLLARDTVLKPLAMHETSFDQTLSLERTRRAAVGHQFNGSKLQHRWSRYSATSAAGLWTTPSDLARFAIVLQQGRTGSHQELLKPGTVTAMVSTQGSLNDLDSKVISLRESIPVQPPPSWGLGIGLIGSPPTWFFHTGSNPGYQCELRASLSGGYGAVIMTNGDQGWRLIRELLDAIAREYRWPDYSATPEVKEVIQLSAADRDRFLGTYEIELPPPARLILEISADNNRLTARIVDFTQKVDLFCQSKDICFTIEDAMTLRFANDQHGRFTEVTSDLGWRARRSRHDAHHPAR